MTDNIQIRNLALRQAVEACQRRGNTPQQVTRVANEFEKYLRSGYQEPPKPERARVHIPNGDPNDVAGFELITVGSADIYPSSHGLEIDIRITIKQYERTEDGKYIILPPIFIDHSDNEENN